MATKSRQTTGTLITPSMSNARKLLRRIVNLPVRVDVGGQAPLRDCVLVDVSADGARLALQGTSTVPADFTMVLSYRGVPRRQCHVVWRSADEIGVTFAAEKPVPWKIRVTEDRPAEPADR